jgi:transketolase
MDSIALARRIRADALRMVHNARASHIGSALSIADIVAVLYADVLRCDPAAPRAAHRDRFILSKGHACVAVYAALAARGFFPRERLASYGQDHSLLMNHISHKVPGVELSTGSLGHGLPFGVGKALSAKLRGEPWRTVVLLSDGELAEGSNWEALLFAAHHRLDNLLAIVDHNNLQSLSTVEDTLGIEPLADKFTAFGCVPRRVGGHDHAALRAALTATPWQPGKPSVLIAATTKGKGVSFMEHQVAWHYRSPDADALARALAEVGDPPDA